MPSSKIFNPNEGRLINNSRGKRQRKMLVSEEDISGLGRVLRPRKENTQRRHNEAKIERKLEQEIVLYSKIIHLLLWLEIKLSTIFAFYFIASFLQFQGQNLHLRTRAGRMSQAVFLALAYFLSSQVILTGLKSRLFIQGAFPVSLSDIR